jgi:thiamine-monophosphate kinase
MNHWNEDQIIQMIARHFASRPDVVPLGIGDDCACICDNQRLITTDASVEGVHFDLAWMSLADAAYRCLASNVSDIAAMGAYAGPFTLALGLPPTLAFADIEAAIGAFRQCIDAHGLDKCWLIGGDVVRSPAVFFSITVLGCLPDWPIVTRSGAHPDDRIYIAGNVGYAAAGLEICRRQLFAHSAFGVFLDAFRRPHALTQFGPKIAKHRLATAMMDLSDGLYCDLPKLLKQSQLGAVIQMDQLHPTNELAKAAEMLGMKPIDWMVCGGEDFGLLITVPPQNQNDFENLAKDCHVPYQNIGICTKQPDIQWIDGNQSIQIRDHSFSHF